MDEPLISIGALHALVYCERLFYLEEVEHIRVADTSVYAGRRLHVELAKESDGSFDSVEVESEDHGLRGRVDVLRRRDGKLIPYEHKRGAPPASAASPRHGTPIAFRSPRTRCSWRRRPPSRSKRRVCGTTRRTRR